MAEPPRFRNHNEFFDYYLQQHSDAGNRRMHAVGMIAGALVAIAALVAHHPWLVLLWIPVGYGFSFAGHFVIEKNKPATFGHPFWSFISDFRMLGLMLTGRLNARLASASPPPASSSVTN
jgi:hypothetical protein